MRELLCRGCVVAAMAAAAACTNTAPSEPSGLVVTEIAAAGVPDDWVEVMNVSEEPLDLDDYVVVDNRKDIDRARPLGSVQLGPGDRYVRVLTDSTVGFRLAGDEELWVFRVGDGALVDGVDWAQGASPPGGSIARRGDTGQFETVYDNTRGRANRD